MIDHDKIVLVLHVESGAWRRHVGALAWAALEHIALAATQDQQGWAARIGVRDIAAGIRVTKDTAARAVAILAAAGLVTRESVSGSDGRRRSGYRLALPPGMELRGRPNDRDTPKAPGDADRCPGIEDTPNCSTNTDTSPAGVVRQGHEPCPKGEDVSGFPIDQDRSRRETPPTRMSNGRPGSIHIKPRRQDRIVPMAVIQPSLFASRPASPTNGLPEPLNPPAQS